MMSVKVLLMGAGVAVAAGMSMGYVMQPHLDTVDRPEGPQMFVAVSAERSTGPFDDGAAYAGYHGDLPDYVVGTDWNKAAAPYVPEHAASAVSDDDSAPTITG